MDPPGSALAQGALRHLVSQEMGRHLFMSETFQGNGRTCATCHVPALEYTITPAAIQAAHERDPEGPLFRAMDSDSGDGASYEILRRHAVFTVTLPLHPRVRLADDPLRRQIVVRRAVPTVVNVALTPPYQLDGRNKDLQEQAEGALLDHMQPPWRPLRQELQSLERFQLQILSPPRLEALVGLVDDPPADFALPLSSAAAVRGKLDFDFHCAVCHDGALLDRPGSQVLRPFQSVLVSERNLPGFPLLRLILTRPDGSEILVQTPDPGRAALTGEIQDLNAFEIRSLRGIKHTPPYFHDNSAATLEDVIQHYNTVFGFDINGRRLEDMLAFLESL